MHVIKFTEFGVYFLCVHCNEIYLIKFLGFHRAYCNDTSLNYDI
jgi:hypothetical protein